MRNYSSKKDIIRHKYLTYIYSKASYLHQYLSFIRRLAASLLALHGKANNATFYILLEMDVLHHQPPQTFPHPRSAFPPYRMKSRTSYLRALLPVNATNIIKMPTIFEKLRNFTA